MTDENDKKQLEKGRKDYDIGYKKPPASTRWQSGQSGNPRGRPKQSERQSWISGETLHEIIIGAGLDPVEYAEKGEKKSLVGIELILKQLIAKAAAGNIRAATTYLEYLSKSVAAKDQMRYEWIMAWTQMSEDKLKVQNKKGTLIFFDVMHKYYMFKRNIRRIEGMDTWPYEPEEPLTEKDWAVFFNAYDALKQGRVGIVAWPLKYPSDE